MDNQHTGPATTCLGRGRHILLEKPLADTFEDCLRIENAQNNTDRVVSVCYTLRYMDAFRLVKKIVSDGTLGELIHIEHMEAIGHFRFAHNYVRGRWRKEADNTNLLLNKCCHDIDFLTWLTNEACVRVSSFGSLNYFTAAHAPQGSGTRCLHDCGIADTCPYSALRLYVDNDLTDKLFELGKVDTREARLEAVTHGPFGVCVWRSDNDVVDHQIVSMEFESGLTATCTMTGYSPTHGRRTRIQGTKAELVFDEAADTITVTPFTDPDPVQVHIPTSDGYHPEDQRIVDNWLAAILDPDSNPMTVNASEAMPSLEIVFAAELSRKQHRTVDIDTLYACDPQQHQETDPQTEAWWSSGNVHEELVTRTSPALRQPEPAD